MNKILEAVMAEFHSWLTCLHSFAARFFFKRRRYGWFAFHAIAAVVSFIASRIHTRDSRSKSL